MFNTKHIKLFDTRNLLFPSEQNNTNWDVTVLKTV